MLGPYFEDLEFRFPRYYLSQILDLADRKGVSVKLHMGYGLPDQLYDVSPYQGREPIITVNDASII